MQALSLSDLYTFRNSGWESVKAHFYSNHRKTIIWDEKEPELVVFSQLITIDGKYWVEGNTVIHQIQTGAIYSKIM